MVSCQESSQLLNVLSTSTSKKRLPQLQLYIDKAGYLRCGERIHNAPLSKTGKFPLLLLSKHPLTTLIVLVTHATVLHGGVNSTVTAIMQKFWIPSAQQYTKKLCDLPKSLR